MASLPLGGVFFAACTAVAVAPIRRPRTLATASWIVSAAPNELPFLFIYIVIASTVPPLLGADIATPNAWISLVITALTVTGLAIVALRALRTRAVLDEALVRALGPRWRSEAGAAANPRHLPWLRILFFPWPFRPRDVERIKNIAYADGGREHLLDVYRHRSHPTNAPTLISLHGGYFKYGRKSFESRPLIHHLTRQGWTCISANYRLSPTPARGFPDHLIDAKRVIVWARTHGQRYGIDPNMIFMAGSSAGAHLTAMVALTANDPAFQPGFETADTTIEAGIGLYGYYGALGGDEHPPSGPRAYVGSTARPLFIIHGDHDTFTPVEGAREFVEDLQATSPQPVAYAELPGAQHSFDVFHSIRFSATVTAIEEFASWIRARARSGHAPYAA